MKSSFKSILIFLCFLLFSFCLIYCSAPKDLDENPLLDENLFDNLDFSKIKLSHYIPALDKGIEEANAVIDKIINSKEEPTFENVILPLEYDFKILNRVDNIFFNLTEIISNAEMQKIEVKLLDKLSKFQTKKNLNKKLFEKIKQVYDKKDSLSLSQESLRLLQLYYNSYIDWGINLSEDKQNILKDIIGQISELTNKFKQNLENESKTLNILLPDDKRLAGLSQTVIDSYRQAADDARKTGFLISINQHNVMDIILVGASDRKLREQVLNLYIEQGKDNIPITKDILNLRTKRAKLMGYKNYASFVLKDTMAKTPERALDLMEQVWNKALKKAELERTELQKFAFKELDDPNFKLEAWDWLYWAEKLKISEGNLDKNEVKKYFELSAVRQGIFTVLGKLYDLEFIKIDKSVYHPDVDIFRVQNLKTKKFIGELYLDYFARDGKGSGSWTTKFRPQSLNKDGSKNITPIAISIFNFLKAAKGQPVLLSMDDVATMFHEMGHASQELLSNCRYPSFEGVARDFVELPSQILEKWAFNREVLPLYAKNIETGEPMPDELIDKIERTSNFGIGFTKTEYISSALVDMKIHLLSKEDNNLDVMKLEKDILKEYGLISEIGTRYRIPYFKHAFSFGYDARYYAYLWSDVLVFDAFELFKEKGIFNREVADSFRKNILSTCGSEDPDVLYKRFSGKDKPSVDAIIESLGLNNN